MDAFGSSEKNPQDILNPQTVIDRFFSKLKKNGLAGFPKSYVASYVDYFFILQLIKIYLLVILQKKKYIHIFHSDKYLVHIVQFIQLSIIVEVYIFLF